MNNLENLFIPTELSKQLIKLGFDKNECIAGRNTLGQIRIKSATTNEGHIISWDKYDNDTPLILWDQAIDWFREKHDISIQIIYNGGLHSDTFKYIYEIYSDTTNQPSEKMSYKKALEQAIIKSIEICKNNL